MSRFSRRVPDGDHRERVSCLDCGHVFYENPKPVVGAVVSHDGRVLLCRRAIEPRRGYWTLPAGYMELGETAEEGARREVQEEAGAVIETDGILALFSISRIGQIQIIYRGRFVEDGRPVFAAGEESLEVGLFGWSDIPWSDLAFPTVRWALEAWADAGSGPLQAPYGNPASDPRGDVSLPGLPDRADPLHAHSLMTTR
ncbi:NUDIX domain-containing protein [Lichenicoccus sp.]|uniref:NUDIX hydrolase n=1 Tax=Lichenicoccus sp. TaxID=2781899 RepID=UPI003D149368